MVKFYSATASAFRTALIIQFKTRNKKIFITSQNHGYAVVKEALPNVIIPTHFSLFDRSLQVFKHKRLPIVAFQGHPEADPGTNDTKIFFQDFIMPALKCVKL